VNPVNPDLLSSRQIICLAAVLQLTPWLAAGSSLRTASKRRVTLCPPEQSVTLQNVADGLQVFLQE